MDVLSLYSLTQKFYTTCKGLHEQLDIFTAPTIGALMYKFNKHVSADAWKKISCTKDEATDKFIRSCLVAGRSEMINGRCKV
jgi:hypothetical protein